MSHDKEYLKPVPHVKQAIGFPLLIGQRTAALTDRSRDQRSTSESPSVR